MLNSPFDILQDLDGSEISKRLFSTASQKTYHNRTGFSSAGLNDSVITRTKKTSRHPKIGCREDFDTRILLKSLKRY